MRMRLAVAAAVLAGGGAAGVTAVSTGHGGPADFASAGYYQPGGRTLSYTGALSSAVKGWSMSPGASLTTISQMKPVVNHWTQSWHRAVIFIQRGTVVAVGKREFAVRSADGRIEIWHVNGGTKTLNVGASSTGMSAMTGGTTRLPSWGHLNTKASGVARGDLVFVFGERENRTLKAQLVLFAAPARTAVMPTATPTATATTPMAAPTTPAAMPSMTTTAPAVTPTGSAPPFSGTNS
jgi:hypothetical protein